MKTKRNWPNGGSGGSGGVAPKSKVITVQIQNKLCDLDLGESYEVFAIKTSLPARVRGYLTDAHRSADLLRSVAKDPSGSNHGLVLEAVTVSNALRVDWPYHPNGHGKLYVSCDIDCALEVYYKS